MSWLSHLWDYGLVWFQDLVECGLFYLFFVGVAYVGVFFLGCIVAALWTPRTVDACFLRIGKLFSFLFILLLVGDFFGCVWGDVIWGRFYISADYAGIDFLPFLPVTRMVLDRPFGDAPHGLIGVTLFQLNLIWFLFALGTWGTTLLLYRRLLRTKPRRPPSGEALKAVA